MSQSSQTNSQPSTLKEQLGTLEKLQELDLKIDDLNRKKAALPAAMKAMDDSFSKAHNSVEAKKKALEEIEKTKRQTQAALDLNNDRLSRANGKLEAVGNSQEFNAANKEIDQIKKMNTGLEEQLKKAGVDQATLSAELETLKSAFVKLEGERDTQASSLKKEGSQFDAEIAALMSQRLQFTNRVEKRILSQYDRVRVARGGIGVVPALGGRCKGCNMVVPPQLYNEVQRGTNLQACPSCHRLLFVPAQAADEGTASSASLS